MKKIFLIAVIGIASTSSLVFAQQKKDKGARITRTEARANAEMRAERTAERMSKELNLTDAQKKDVYTIALDNFKTEKTSETSQKEFNLKLDNVLTVDQKAVKLKLDNEKKALKDAKVEKRASITPTGERKALKQ